MVKIVGLLACLAIAAIPVAVEPKTPLLAAAAVSALACAAGLLQGLPGLTVCGAVTALLVFSVALLTSGVENASVQALLMGTAMLAVIETTHHRSRFRRATVAPGIDRAHLTRLGWSVLVSLAAAALLAVLALLVPFDFSASLRPGFGTAGSILVMVALLRALRGPSRPAVDDPAG